MLMSQMLEKQQTWLGNKNKEDKFEHGLKKRKNYERKVGVGSQIETLATAACSFYVWIIKYKFTRKFIFDKIHFRSQNCHLCF